MMLDSKIPFWYNQKNDCCSCHYKTLLNIDRNLTILLKQTHFPLCIIFPVNAPQNQSKSVPRYSLRSKTASLSPNPEVCWTWRSEKVTVERPVCRGPWTEVGPAPRQGLRPDCGLCCGRRCCHWGVPVQEVVWPCWPPALCVSAPASATPESPGGRGRWSWTFPGSRFVIPGRRSSEGSPWLSGIPLPAGTPCPTSPPTPCWGSYEVD